MGGGGNGNREGKTRLMVNGIRSSLPSLITFQRLNHLNICRRQLAVEPDVDLMLLISLISVIDFYTLLQISAVHHSYVQPQDLTKINWDWSKERGITEENIKTAPNLHEVLQQVITAKF